MDAYAPIVRRILLPAMRWREGRRDFKRFFHEFARTQYLSPAELRDVQLHRLQALIHHAYDNCPYYRRQFQEAGITPAAVRDVDDLPRVPTLSKEQVRANLDDLVARDHDRDRLRRDQTGGSTGSALTFYRDTRRGDARLAVAYRHDGWTGWRIGERTSYIWGALRDSGPLTNLRWRLRSRLVRRQTLLNCAAFDEASMHAFAVDLRRWRPALVIAYSGAGYLFARYLLDKRLEVPPPKAIITTAELLQPHQRGVIEQAFGAPVFDRYGAREMGVIASECERHQGLHIAADSVLVEVIANGRPAAPGEPGQIVVTDLLNYGMPMIRYRIGDDGVLSGRHCDCGRGLPLMDMVAGRTSDFLVTRSGALVSAAYLTCVVAERIGLEHVMFIQDSLDRILIKVVPGHSFTTADLDYLEQRLRQLMGPGVIFSRELVNHIDRGPSGKYRFCICNVPSDASEALAGLPAEGVPAQE
jgi:phenylacetate-CoA ligase